MFYTNPCSKVFLLKSKSFLFSFLKLIFDLIRSTGAVDRVCVSLVRSTGPVDRSSGRCTYQCACLPVDRGGRPRYCFCSQFFSVDRVGRPLAYNGRIFELPVDRPSRPMCPLNSNGQILSELFIFVFCV